MKYSLSSERKIAQLRAALAINPAVAAQHPEHDAIGALFNCHSHIPLHDRIIRLRVAEASTTWPDHRHHWNFYSVFGFENGAERGREPAEEKGGTEFNAVRAALLRLPCISRGAAADFKQELPCC